jgi:hypothetical protein
VPQLRQMRFALIALTVLAPCALAAQGTFKGRVRADSITPIVAAELEIAGRSTRTDSAGRFEISGIPAGPVTAIVRAIGFENALVTMFIENGRTVQHEFRLNRIERPAQPLDRVEVKGTAERPGLAPHDFYARKQAGIGRQYDRTDLAKWDERPFNTFMSTIPGARVTYGGRNFAMVTTRSSNTGGRGVFSGSPSPFAVLTPADVNAGFRPACYMDVYMNGMLVYQYGSTPPQPLFDFSTLSTRDFEAIEVYSSAAQLPVQYSRTSSGCGIVLIWTRISSPEKRSP